MSTQEASGGRWSAMISTAITLLANVTQALGAVVDSRAAQIAAVQRRALHRVAVIVALLLLAVALGCAAMGFAAAAVWMAFGEHYRILAAVVLAAGFLLCAALAAPWQPPWHDGRVLSSRYRPADGTRRIRVRRRI